jgi:hypothetical protein
MDQLEAAL